MTEEWNDEKEEVRLFVTIMNALRPRPQDSPAVDFEEYWEKYWGEKHNHD